MKLGDCISVELGGHPNRPPRPIHLSLKFKFKISRTMSAKFSGAQKIMEEKICGTTFNIY